jgi:hypothetical protein
MDNDIEHPESLFCEACTALANDELGRAKGRMAAFAEFQPVRHPDGEHLFVRLTSRSADMFRDARTIELSPNGSKIIEIDVTSTFPHRERLWPDGCRTRIESTEADHGDFHDQIARIARTAAGEQA